MQRTEGGADPNPPSRNGGGVAEPRWAYAAVLETLRAGCGSAHVPTFTPHALRRAVAADAASKLPRPVVALAGGWKGLERLDDHYVRPHALTIWGKLDRHSYGSPGTCPG
jgi:hypothetical protein